MARLRTLVLLMIGVMASHAFAGAVGADSVPTPLLVADVEGIPIPATSAADYYCHDFEYPLIHCFNTNEALEDAVAVYLADSRSSLNGATILAVNYVRIFDYSAYAGTNFYVSADYSNLANIGWNDRISSYRAMNSETGAFYTDTVYSGTIDYFCCNDAVGSLSSTFDNRISSVRRT